MEGRLFSFPDFKLNPDELERWFTKIDHIFEHTRVPQIGEVLTPFYKISVDKGQRHHLPIISHINYNFSVHAIEMGVKVTSIIEHAINVLARKDDISSNRDEKDALWQVDMDLMDVIFTSLVEYLELDSAYNIFILNPKHDLKRAKYGYRRGLSWSEIDFLKKDENLQTKILESGTVPESVLAFEKIKRPLYEKHPMPKFAWTVVEDTDTAEWYNNCLDVLNNVEKLYQGKDISEIILSKALQLLEGKNKYMKLLLKKELKAGDLAGFQPECLTDTWIGKDRWAFIDLSAGPFAWGPAVGGEGVRTELSLPNVEKTIGAVTANKMSPLQAPNCNLFVPVLLLQLSLYSVFNFSAVIQKFLKMKLKIACKKQSRKNLQYLVMYKDHQAVDILLAEIDIYELFAFKHCKGRRVKLALCEELDERMRDLKNELQSLEGEENDESPKKKAMEALKRMENWNLFSDTQ
ncbi:unnamed protein product [Linum tenue]|uniref:DUF7906 domain-containing protein n=1 Tax=Linum tenue TaxID=586396 RepID=A0AAV0S502_9ROSI|nr:unnamed protein product [Linum tenue]